MGAKCVYTQWQLDDVTELDARVLYERLPYVLRTHPDPLVLPEHIRRSAYAQYAPELLGVVPQLPLADPSAIPKASTARRLFYSLLTVVDHTISGYAAPRDVPSPSSLELVTNIPLQDSVVFDRLSLTLDDRRDFFSTSLYASLLEKPDLTTFAHLVAPGGSLLRKY